MAASLLQMEICIRLFIYVFAKTLEFNMQLCGFEQRLAAH